MSVQTPHPKNANSDSARLQMEQSIDRLAEAARKGLEPNEFFSEVLSCALQSGGAERALLWRHSPDGVWELACEIPAEIQRSDGFIADRQSHLDVAAKSSTPHLLNENSGTKGEASAQSAGRVSQILSPIRQSTNAIGILETWHPASADDHLASDTLPFFAALCEITADYLSQQELDQLRRARIHWQQWDQFTQALWSSLELAAVCITIANDGRLVGDCDRLSVLVRSGSTFRLRAISGVSAIEPRASVTRMLESLAQLCALKGQSVWYRTEDHQNLDAANLMSSLQRYTQDSGITGIGLIPIAVPAEGHHPTSPCAVLILEKFHAFTELESWTARGELLAERCGPVLRVSIEQSRIPWLGLWRSTRSLTEWWLSPTVMFVMAILIAATCALVFIPAELTISGTAELWPAHRRDVFAASSGIVEKILVAHGDEVTKDQPLIMLRDPALESDAPRILGEIATLNERLKGVQAARFIGGNAPDTASRSRQLTVDEEELKERLQTLERQRELIEERQNNLTLASPISGKVLTWDVDQLLSARPVERGQTLLTIGDTAGPWILEVHVPDKDAGYLIRARKDLTTELEVDFLLPSDPDKVYHGRIQNVASGNESDDSSHSSLRVVVAFDAQQMANPRAGATAIPRIHCGSRPLGYVWLRDLIDAIRTKLLF